MSKRKTTLRILLSGALLASLTTVVLQPANAYVGDCGSCSSGLESVGWGGGGTYWSSNQVVAYSGGTHGGLLVM